MNSLLLGVDLSIVHNRGLGPGSRKTHSSSTGYTHAFPQPTVAVLGGGGETGRGGCHLGSCVFLLALGGPAS